MSGLDVKILSIHWENIRAFAGSPYHDSLSFPATNGDQYQDLPNSTNVFLQMPNGTGKTTTLHLLRSVCIGKLWTSPEKEEKDPMSAFKRISDDETEDTSDEQGIFKTRMQINGEKYGFEIRFDHESGKEEWTTETPKGKRNGWHPPPEFSRAFRNNPRLIELFVFDAETARRVQSRTDKHILERAIRQFGGLSEVYRLVGEPGTSGKFVGGRFETLVDSLTTKLGKGGKKHSNLENVLKKAIQQKKFLEGDLASIKEDHEKLIAQIADLDDELDKFDEFKEAMDVVKQLKDKAEILDDEVEEATSILIGEFVNPARLFTRDWSEIMAFHRDHQDRNLPEDVGKGWLVSMSEQDCCLCGIEFNDETRAHFRDHIGSLLDRNKMIAVSEMQTAFSESPVADRQPLSAAKTHAVELASQLDNVRTQLEVAYNEKLSEEKDAERREKKEERDKLIVQLDICQGRLEILTTTNYVWLHQEGLAAGLNADGKPTTTLGNIPRIENISVCEDVIKNARSELALAQGFQHLERGLEDSREVIGDALNKVSEEMREKVSETATKAWKSMPAAGSESKRLRIEVEQNGLFIYQGARPRGNVSGAQIVSACYSVTKAIGGLGQINFPLICDTPFAGFDFVMVSAWYESIADSFDQVICFVNTQEKKTLIDSVWDPTHPELKTLGDDDYRATILPSEKPAGDGGKHLQLTTDRDIFNSVLLKSDEGKIGGD